MRAAVLVGHDDPSPAGRVVDQCVVVDRKCEVLAPAAFGEDWDREADVQILQIQIPEAYSLVGTERRGARGRLAKGR